MQCITYSSAHFCNPTRNYIWNRLNPTINMILLLSIYRYKKGMWKNFCFFTCPFMSQIHCIVVRSMSSFLFYFTTSTTLQTILQHLQYYQYYYLLFQNYILIIRIYFVKIFLGTTTRWRVDGGSLCAAWFQDAKITAPNLTSWAVIFFT